ncbi:hypothetical protein ACFVWG_10995 [Kribbella sp. NPDC058245]
MQSTGVLLELVALLPGRWPHLPEGPQGTAALDEELMPPRDSG